MEVLHSAGSTLLTHNFTLFGPTLLIYNWYTIFCRSLIMQCSAFSRSVTVVRLFDLFLLMCLRRRATAQVARDQDENLDRRSTRLTHSLVLVLRATALLTSVSLIINSGTSSAGSLISLIHKNVGPVSQVDDRSSLVVKPLEVWSAGFSLVGTLRWIFWTQLAMKVWNRRASFLM